MKRNTGKDEQRARDLFYALWIPDIFMARVENNEDWCLFCPNEAKGLISCHGKEFENLYESYEKQPDLVRKKVKARDLWFAIIDSQIETGTPYMLYKDSCNKKSNQQNLGTIRCSNLCTETILYSNSDEVPVCTLCSIPIPEYINGTDIDHDMLHNNTRTATRALSFLVKKSCYPIPEAKKSNYSNKPIGVGVQGFATALKILKISWDSNRATELNKSIFETMYHAELTESCELAKKYGPYENFKGSPLSKGIFQFDMWGVKPSDRWDWETLRSDIMKYGVYNSEVGALMPTATTAQINSYSESFEPDMGLIYTRKILSGEFISIDPLLVKELKAIGLWTKEIRNKIIKENSIQGIMEIPKDIRDIYKTAFEIQQKRLIDLASDRGPFVSQSQSFNCHFSNPTHEKLSIFHMYGWKRGLKTGMYYLRSKAGSNGINSFRKKESRKNDSNIKVDEETNTNNSYCEDPIVCACQN